jgi:ketosteroid isomerase-like protein
MKLTILLITALLASVLVDTVPARSDEASKVEQELRALVRAWDEAFVKGDTATLDRLLADEFAFVGGAKKTDYLASFKTRPADAIQSAVSTDIQVQVYGDTAILVGVDTISGQNKGQPSVTKWLYMDVWVKRDGRWQCVKTYASAAK